MGTVFPHCDGGTKLEAPILHLRVGKGLFRPGDLSASRTATQVRSEAVFVTNARGRVLHFIVASFQAGAPWSPVFAVVEVEAVGLDKVGRNEA
jgi:hypothetical protein